MKQPETYEELDKLIGQTFWTFGFYIGPYSYKLENINSPQEVVLGKEEGSGYRRNTTRYPLRNKTTNMIVGYFQLTPNRYNLDNYKLYEESEEAIEGWNSTIQNQLDRLEFDYEKKKKYLNKKIIKK